MYHSCLLVDVGKDTDRPRPGRRWLRNLYRVHQRLSMAFSSAAKKADDPHFLRPFKGEDSSPHVHVDRIQGGFLFRVFPVPGANPVILVRSASQPDWDYAFRNAQYLLAAPPSVSTFTPEFATGQRWRFSLRANPTKRVATRSCHPSGAPLDPKWIGKRVPVPIGELDGWLARQAQSAGFELMAPAGKKIGYVYFNKTGERGAGQRLFSVVFEGILAVTEPGRFLTKFRAGIGPGKAFGFGLLSLARA